MSEWEYEYQLYVDNEPTKIHLLGPNKTEAYKMMPSQWEIAFPNKPIPKQSLCKLITVAGPYPAA